MGVRIRKSINLGGGVKVNLSKSGVGYSVGTKGYRVTKTAKGTVRKSISVPGTGLSYVEETGKSKNRKTSSNSRTTNHNIETTMQDNGNEYPRKDMKLLELKCPNCGSALKVDIDTKECTCEFCGTKFLVDDHVVHHKIDGAEEAGYQFEKGRQRAQAEQQEYSAAATIQPKKRKTWLWVLGWICIFPVPLTLILLKKDMKKGLKYGLIALAWIVYLIIALSGGSTTTDQSTISGDETSKSVVYYEGDEVVNRFISDYNSQNETGVSKIEGGNIEERAFGYIGDVYIEMLDSYEATADSFTVTINGGNSDQEVNAMIDVFPSVLKTLDSSVNEEELNKVLSAMKSGERGDYTVGSVEVSIYLPVDTTSGVGNANIRIELSSKTYAKPN